MTETMHDIWMRERKRERSWEREGKSTQIFINGKRKTQHSYTLLTYDCIVGLYKYFFFLFFSFVKFFFGFVFFCIQFNWCKKMINLKYFTFALCAGDSNWKANKRRRNKNFNLINFESCRSTASKYIVFMWLFVSVCSPSLLIIGAYLLSKYAQGADQKCSISYVLFDGWHVRFRLGSSCGLMIQKCARFKHTHAHQR